MNDRMSLQQSRLETKSPISHMFKTQYILQDVILAGFYAPQKTSRTSVSVVCVSWREVGNWSPPLSQPTRPVAVCQLGWRAQIKNHSHFENYWLHISLTLWAESCVQRVRCMCVCVCVCDTPRAFSDGHEYFCRIKTHAYISLGSPKRLSIVVVVVGEGTKTRPN